MLRTWLNSDSPVYAKTYKKMNSLRWKAWAWAQSLVLIVILARCLSPVQCFGANLDSEFTYLLPPGRAECFFQPAIKNGTMEVEYQVIAGAGMDVDFSIISPHGISLFFEARRSDGVHVVEPTEEGDYQICFDNTFSRFSEKLVFFEIIIEGQGGDVGDDEWPGLDEPEGSLLEYKLDDIRESMDGLHRRLERSRQMQVVLRAFEARDRNLLEDNLWRVSFWSCTSVVVLLCVALTQVVVSLTLIDSITVRVPPFIHVLDEHRPPEMTSWQEGSSQDYTHEK